MNQKILKRILLTTAAAATAMAGGYIIHSLKRTKHPKQQCWLYIKEKSPWASGDSTT